MNERIKEIIGDATLYADSYFDRDCAAWRKIYNEKFAELIVRECAEVSKNYAGGSMPLSIALAIKKHFGVEE
jgi:hypothetical protein